jgi:cell division protein FtsB
VKEPRWEDARFRRAALWGLALLTIALIVHEIFGANGYLALRRKRQELQDLQLQVEQLKQENQKLEEQVKALKSDPKAVEKLAREEMKLARPGEIIYVLPDKQPKNETPPATAKENPPK